MSAIGDGSSTSAEGPSEDAGGTGPEHEGERTLEALISNLPGMAYRMDRHEGAQPAEFMSAGWERLTGLPMAYARQQGAQMLLSITHPEDRERTAAAMSQALAAREPFELRFRIVRADGKTRWLCEHGRGVYEGDRLVSVEGFVSDVTDSHMLALELEHQAMHDPLTGLPNRRAFEDRLEVLTLGVNEQGRSGAVAYLDLDRFKMVNDSCGHAAGDALLWQLSRHLLAGVRERAMLARLGGDEFALLMQRSTIEQAWSVCEDVRAMVQDFRFDWEGHSYGLGCSVGLVPVVAPCATPGEIMVAADNACYRAKDEGRDRIHMLNFESADGGVRGDEARRLAVIEEAISEQRLSLVRQDIVALNHAEDGLQRFEVLLRLRDGQGVEHAPAPYLAVAERHGLSGRIDRFTVSTTLRWLERYMREPRAPVDLCCINLSAYSMIDPRFLQFVLEELDASGVPGQCLCFELTETAAVSNLAQVRGFMSELRRHGCRFALDDFGTGVSSFGYLKSLPVDLIKIDGMFVRDVLHDPIDLELVRAINSIAHAMGKQTVAEFVESDAVCRCMQRLGVDFAQGYQLGRPQPL